MEDKKIAEKAQEALEQLSQGKKTINQVRQEFGLKPINDDVANTPITKA